MADALVTVWEVICKVDFFVCWQLVLEFKGVLIPKFREVKWLGFSFVVAYIAIGGFATDNEPIAFLKTTLYI